MDGKQVKNLDNPTGTGKYLDERGQYVTLPSGGGSFTTIEANLGNQPRLSGEFTITGTGFAVGRPVLITQAMGPYTGKGTLADEAADQCTATAVVINSTTIKCIWAAVRSPLKGNVKFNYTIL
jgi:hypothetical protein